MHNPSSTHWSAAKHVLRYLKHTPDCFPRDLCISKPSVIWIGQATLMIDDPPLSFDFLECQEAKSCLTVQYRCSPYVLLCLALTIELTLALITAKLLWIRILLKELRVFLPTPPILWCDNVSALALASNPVYHARTKHIEVDYHFIHEKVLNGDLVLKFISTLDQAADIFTKG
jgi:hypothetical protein